jgi:hypothetical protein
MKKHHSKKSKLYLGFQEQTEHANLLHQLLSPEFQRYNYIKLQNDSNDKI